jgi:hypothetical protein
MNIIFYTNCQGDCINNFFKLNSLEYNSYNVTILYNWYYKNELPIDLLKICDIFIYQPVDIKHGIYNSYNNNGILQYLNDKCIKISFPSLYLDGLWPIYEEGGKYIGGEYIDNIKNIHTINEIIKLYEENKIDFKLENRIMKSINYMKLKESITTIKIADYIHENYKNIKLFNTQNHPTNVLIKKISLEINNYLNLKLNENIIDINTDNDTMWYYSSYSKNILNYKININDDYYKNLINKIYTGEYKSKIKYENMYIENCD